VRMGEKRNHLHSRRRAAMAKLRPTEDIQPLTAFWVGEDPVVPSGPRAGRNRARLHRRGSSASGQGLAGRSLRAGSVQDTTFERVELLLQFPDQAREVPEVGRADLREVIYEERHRIVYRVDSDWIRILLVHPSPKPMSPEELDTSE
jgi:hypothetical protein